MASSSFSTIPEIPTSLSISQGTVDSICCPVSLEPFEDAQMVNCDGGHTFSLSTILTIFGNLNDRKLCEKPGPCPLCRDRVTSYRLNRALQDLVNSILGIDKGEEHSKKMFETIRKLKIEFDSGIKYPFPKVLFTDTRMWRAEGCLGVLLYNKCFSAEVKNENTINYISFTLERSRYRLDIDFPNKKTMIEAENYFRKNNIFMENEFELSSRDNILTLGEPAQILCCLRLLMSNNDFDERASSAFSEIISVLGESIETQ